MTAEQKDIILTALYQYNSTMRLNLLSAASRPQYWEHRIKVLEDTERLIESMEVEDASEN